MIDGRTYCKCAVGVAIACMEDFRPKGNVTPTAAAQYIREVLELALCNSGIEIAVQPIAYPASSKIPLNITLMGYRSAAALVLSPARTYKLVKRSGRAHL
jgi:hypothetical protein